MAASNIDCSAIARAVYELAEYHAKVSGVSKIDDLVDILVNDHPALNREQVTNAIAEASAGAATAKKRAVSNIAKLRKEARTDVQLRATLEGLEKHLKEGTLPAPRETTTEAAPETQDLRARVAEVRHALQNSEAGITGRLKKQINQMLGELEATDFAHPVETKERPVTRDLQRLIDERDKLRRKINQKIADAAPKSIFGHFANASAAHRFMRAGYDFSAVGVQNVFNTLSHPVATYRNMIDGFRSMGSETAAAREMEEIQNRDNAPWYSVGKLRISDIGGDLTTGEEGLVTGMLRRMPEAIQEKFGKLGYIPAKFAQGGHALGRGGTVFLNKMRADLFDTYANAFTDGVMNPQRAQQIAGLVNAFTGASSLGRFEKMAPELAATLFSARNFASQIAREITIPARLVAAETLNVAGKEHTVLGGKELSRAVTKHYGRFLSGAATLYASAIAAGWEVDKDPNKSTFGNITMPGTNISFNPLGGMRTLFVLLRKTVRGKRTRSDGREVVTRGEKSARGDDFDSGLMQFARGKEAPLVGAAHDWIAGKDNRGREVTLYSTIGNNLVPMSPEDMYQAVKDAGLPKGLAASTLIFFGVPTQIYDAEQADTRSRR